MGCQHLLDAVAVGAYMWAVQNCSSFLPAHVSSIGPAACSARVLLGLWCDTKLCVCQVIWQNHGFPLYDKSGNIVKSNGCGREDFSHYIDSVSLCFFWTMTFEPCDPALLSLGKSGRAPYIIQVVQRLLCITLLQSGCLMETKQMKLWA